ncbi:MAG: hypothetical protein OIN66_01800 [Candidatus Methanoperedens sp.]|nr:hypothetical protein [Candidatus Methanoperedens sp.]
MDKQLDLKNIVLIGRTFDEYYRMFALDDVLKNETILDVASGVSSFCAEANAKGYNVTASDKIYTCAPSEIGQKCASDLDTVIKQLPDIADLYVWDYFKDIQSLKAQREKAYKSFIEDFKKHGRRRYVPVEYPAADFAHDQFTISLVSHFLFLYEDRLDYSFHRRTVLELLRITSKEIRVFPIVNLKGKRSSLVEPLMYDTDFQPFQISIKKVGYEFMKGANEMLVIKK